jgi:hypothetical protein
VVYSITWYCCYPPFGGLLHYLVLLLPPLWWFTPLLGTAATPPLVVYSITWYCCYPPLVVYSITWYCCYPPFGGLLHYLVLLLPLFWWFTPLLGTAATSFLVVYSITWYCCYPPFGYTIACPSSPIIDYYIEFHTAVHKFHTDINLFIIFIIRLIIGRVPWYP